MLQEAWIWILIIIGLVVAAPVVADFVGRKDYQDQVNGKKKERKWKGKTRYDNPSPPDMKYEAIKEEAVQKTKGAL